MTREIKSLAALLLLAAIVFGINAGGYDLWPADEPRYAEVAREMTASGDYLVPRVNGETYLEKPPLLFWMMSIAGNALGEVNEWAARLPSILSAVYVVGITFLLARGLFDARVAFWACLILMSCVRFWWQARSAQIDMALTACMLTVLYAFWRWDAERRGRWLLTAYAAMAAGMLLKGPPALVFPLLFLGAYYWKNNTTRKQTHWVLGTLAATVVTLIWFVPARMAGADTAAQAVESGIAGNLFRNTVGRFIMGVSKAQAPWYYLETIPVDMLPWTLICPPVLYWAWKNRAASQPMWLLYSWVAPAFIFFSICIGKRALYLLPLFPAFAIIFSAALVHLLHTDNTRWLKRGAIAWSALLLLIAFSPLALPFIPVSLQNSLHLYVFAGSAGLAGAVGLFLVTRKGAHLVPGTMTAQTLLIFCVAVFSIFPEVDHFKSARTICAPVRELVERGEAFELYSVGFSREEYIYYSRAFHEPVFTGLIGDVAPEDLMAQAKLQKEARKTIARAVDEVPIDDLQQITPDERRALANAIETAVAAHEDASALLAFETDLQASIAEFFALLDQPTPALAFVQEEDWRWLVPLYAETIPVSIVVDRPVGSRHVLLLANKSAVALLTSAPKAPVQ